MKQKSPWRDSAIPVRTTPKDAGSWWLDLSRREFVEAIAIRAPHMASAKESTYVPFRILL